MSSNSLYPYLSLPRCRCQNVRRSRFVVSSLRVACKCFVHKSYSLLTSVQCLCRCYQTHNSSSSPHGVCRLDPSFETFLRALSSGSHQLQPQQSWQVRSAQELWPIQPLRSQPRHQAASRCHEHRIRAAFSRRYIRRTGAHKEESER
jgi:hypothetical protein